MVNRGAGIPEDPKGIVMGSWLGSLFRFSRMLILLRQKEFLRPCTGLPGAIVYGEIRMSSESPKHKGVAALFTPGEIRRFLRNYLLFIGMIEAIIFFVAFFSYLGGPQESFFPWRSYFFSAFIVPIGITFLLGIFVMSFNRYLFGEDSLGQENGTPDPGAGKMALRIHAFFRTTRQIPFLVLLIFLGLGAGIFYKIDSIVAFVARFGEKSVQYILIGLAILLVAGGLFFIVWMILNYRLQAAAISYRHQYRNEVVKRLGFVILEDETVINGEGEVVQTGTGTVAGKPELLPPVIRKIRREPGETSGSLLLEVNDAHLSSLEDDIPIAGKEAPN